MANSQREFLALCLRYKWLLPVTVKDRLDASLDDIAESMAIIESLPPMGNLIVDITLMY